MKIPVLALRLAARRREGYSLAEVLVGTGILGTVFFSLYAGMTNGFAYTQLCRENLRATQIMAERIEGLRLYRWDQITNPSFFVTNFTAWYYPLEVTNGGGGIKFYGQIRLSPPTGLEGAAYFNDLRLVTVTLTWTNGNGPQGQPIVRQRQMQTYVARNGMQHYVYYNTEYLRR